MGQQSAGKVNSGSGLTVSAPGDVHEREAEAVAKKVTTAGAEVHRQAEEEEVQMQPEEEEEEIQTQPEEEEEVQMQPVEERLEEMLP